MPYLGETGRLVDGTAWHPRRRVTLSVAEIKVLQKNWNGVNDTATILEKDLDLLMGMGSFHERNTSRQDGM